jgi:hypothetical protein
MQPRRRETRVQDSLSLRPGWAPIRLGRRGEKLEIYPLLCEGFLQPPCVVPCQDPRTDFGPCLPSRVAWAPSTTTNVVLHYLPSFQLSSCQTFPILSCRDRYRLRRGISVLPCNATGEHLASPGASVSREGFAILEE